MLQKLKEYIDSTQLLNANDRILLAVSGGLDSMVMLHFFQKLPYYFEVAHMNFGLRGGESDADQRFVEDYCRENSIILHTHKVDTIAFMQKHKVSVQMAARDLRYNWFDEIKENRKLKHVATAHHSDDSIETIFINIIRGTGISGLKGIVSNERAIRPLLCFSREEIHSYATSNNITWREDSSNAKEDYLRNKLRHSVLPILDSVSEYWKANLIQLSNDIAVSEQILEGYYITNEPLFFQNNKIDIKALLELPHSKWMFQRLLARFNFTYDTSNDIFSKLEVQKGKVFESISYRIIKEDDCFELLARKDEHSDEIDFVSQVDDRILVRNLQYEIQKIATSSFNGKFEQSQAYLDFNKLNFPLLIRKWQVGDWFIPFGMKGKKKLSDYFVDEKFTIQEKENTFVLVSAEDIVCILGHRTDDRYRIKEDTSIIYHIKQKHG